MRVSSGSSWEPVIGFCRAVRVEIEAEAIVPPPPES